MQTAIAAVAVWVMKNVFTHWQGFSGEIFSGPGAQRWGHQQLSDVSETHQATSWYSYPRPTPSWVTPQQPQHM